MSDKNDNSNARWKGMATFGALMGGVPGLLFNPTGDLIFSVVLGILSGIIFWVGVGVILDEI